MIMRNAVEMAMEPAKDEALERMNDTLKRSHKIPPKPKKKNTLNDEKRKKK